MTARARRWGARARPAWRRVVTGVALTLASPFVLVAVVAALTPLPRELLSPPSSSLRILSSTGSLLREVRADDGSRARPLHLGEVSPYVRQAVLAAEDRRFYSHPGIDVLAALRALLTDVAHAKIVSGASTLTMQLARTLRPHRRTLWGKIREAGLALRIEASLSKDKILEEYLNRVSFGPNVRGYATASLAYFDVSPASLSRRKRLFSRGCRAGQRSMPSRETRSSPSDDAIACCHAWRRKG